MQKSERAIYREAVEDHIADRRAALVGGLDFMGAESGVAGGALVEIELLEGVLADCAARERVVVAIAPILEQAREQADELVVALIEAALRVVTDPRRA